MSGNLSTQQGHQLKVFIKQEIEQISLIKQFFKGQIGFVNIWEYLSHDYGNNKVAATCDHQGVWELLWLISSFIVLTKLYSE